MTTQEIKDLIASAIAGQGNQVDSGGKLAEILNELVDMAAGKPYLEITDLPAAQMTKEQLEATGLTQDAIRAIYNGELDAHFVSYPVAGSNRYLTIQSVNVSDSPMEVEGISLEFQKTLYTVTYMLGNPIITVG